MDFRGRIYPTSTLFNHFGMMFVNLLSQHFYDVDIIMCGMEYINEINKCWIAILLKHIDRAYTFLSEPTEHVGMRITMSRKHFQCNGKLTSQSQLPLDMHGTLPFPIWAAASLITFYQGLKTFLYSSKHQRPLCRLNCLLFPSLYQHIITGRNYFVHLQETMWLEVCLCLLREKHLVLVDLTGSRSTLSTWLDLKRGFHVVITCMNFLNCGCNV